MPRTIPRKPGRPKTGQRQPLTIRLSPEAHTKLREMARMPRGPISLGRIVEWLIMKEQVQ